MQSKLKKLLGLVLTLFAGFGLQAQAQEVPNRTAAPTPGGDQSAIVERATRRAVLNNARAAAAARTKAALQAKGGKVDPKTLGVNPAGAAKVAALAPKGGTVEAGLAVPGLGFQLAQPDYLNGTASNWNYTKKLRKFVDTLPGLGVANANNLGNYIPVGTPDQATYIGSDYYEIDLVEYTQKLHSDLAPTKLRGYIQHGAAGVNTIAGASNYLGPVIIAHKDRPVRVKFTNLLPIGARDATTGRRPGDLFIPVDTTLMGAGPGPLYTPAVPAVLATAADILAKVVGISGLPVTVVGEVIKNAVPATGTETFTENRGELHLHGGLSPWISDGTPHQWITPAGETTSYKKGASFQNVPDMSAGATPGDGIATYYWTNQQSGRFMFYHDHSFGLTRLNVYAGEAAGYLIVDPVDDKLISAGILPNNGGGVYNYGIPLVIQDKTFVDTTTLGKVGVANIDPLTNLPTPATDPTWDTVNYGGDGALWYPHVYMVNQNPTDISGANAMGRWDYGPWFWPPLTAAAGLLHGAEPVPNDPNGAEIPGTPNPSLVPEAFMDTPLVNGTAYPKVSVKPQSYRFRILNAANDRFWNLSFFQADATGTEVTMVPAAPNPLWPANWPHDGRDGGVPDPATAGPAFIQIGNESGFLPNPVVINPQPVGYNYNRRDIVVLNVAERGLWLGPAERADVIVDFSAFAGKKLILYNDSPAPVPAFDSRLDYYTGDPDQRDSGGAGTTLAGFGPNTRTIMLIEVAASNPAAPFNMAALNSAFTSTATSNGAFAEAQHPPIVPSSVFNGALNKTLKDVYVRIQDNNIPLFAAMENGELYSPSLLPKAIQELFELDYGRMNATLGVELPFTNFNIQTTIPLGYVDPATEILTDGSTQFWKITHNGVDSHPVHFHLFDVQIVNRVGWDGAVRFPDDNERGWKETVKMHPLEDIIVAFRPISPRLPFVLPNSLRSPNVLAPASANIDVTNPLDGNALTISNAAVNYGWEYVWHCHILGHEENDFMRPMVLNVATTLPLAPDTLTATIAAAATNRADLTWADHSTDETGFSIKRRTGGAGLFTEIATVVPNVRSFSDFNVIPGTQYDYQVAAYNQFGESAPSNTAGINTPAPVLVAGSVYTFDGVSNVPLAGVTIAFSGGPSPVTTDAAGNYTASVPVGWTGSITPSLATYAFTPASISIATALTANLTGQNFLARPATLTISGIVANVPAATTATVTAFDGINTVSTTVAVGGAYSLTLPNPYTGTLTPTGTGLLFSPASRTYTAASGNQAAQNFSAAVQITGTALLNGVTPMSGVTLSYAGGSTTTAADGSYTITQTPGWTGTVTPFKTGYFFTPVSTSYASLNASTVSNYTAVAGVEIAGQAYIPGTPILPLAGVTVSFLTGGTVNAGSAVTDASGFYYMFVPSGWSGTASASLPTYVFAPVNRNFINVTTTQTGRNFVATAVVTYSGHVASGATSLAGVRVTFSNGGGAVSVTTDASGNYTITLNSGWTGTITPTLRGYTFSPASAVVTTPVTVASVQDFNTVQTITGRARILATGVGIPGVTITLSTGGTTTTNANGNFTIQVPTGWTGSLSPSAAGYTTWTPATFSYTNLTANVTGLRFNGQ